MEETKVFTQEQKTDSLRKALIEAGYDMASSQAESMVEDTESWREDMIDDKINPKCFGIKMLQDKVRLFFTMYGQVL